MIKKRLVYIGVSAVVLVGLLIGFLPASPIITGEGTLSLETSVALAANKIPDMTAEQVLQQFGENDIVWAGIPTRVDPEFVWNGSSWELPEDGYFGAILPNSSDGAFIYTAEGSYISLTPTGIGYDGKQRVGNKNKPLDMSPDGKYGEYIDAYEIGVDLRIDISQCHWQKIISFGSAEIMTWLPSSAVTVDMFFDLETDFNLPDGVYTSHIPIGGNVFIECPKIWDSSEIPIYGDDNNIIGYENRKIPVQIEVSTKGINRSLVKTIPADWVRDSTFPVYTDLDITWGTASEFESGVTLYVQCCEIDTDKFVVVFRDDDDGDAGKARVATVSGTTITWGAVSEFCSDVGIGIGLGVCKLDTDKFAVVYADDAQLDDGYARVGTVSGTTISWGTAVEFYDGDVEYPSCCQIDTDKFAIAYNDEFGGDDGAVCICTVSGTTITAGTPVDFDTSLSYSLYNSCCPLDTDKFVIVYQKNVTWGSDEPCYACAVTVSGTTPSPGTPTQIDSNRSGDQSCAQLDTDKFVAVWEDITDSKIEAAICTVSGTTITVGTPVDLNAETAYYGTGVAKIDATHFVAIYADVGNSNKGTSRYCSFSGTTITLDGEEIWHDAETAYSAICLISTGKVAVAYCDDADASDHGEAIVGDTPSACSEDISNTPSTWNVNGGTPVATSSEYVTGLTNFTVTNSSGGAVSISISGTDMTGGGYTWTLSDTATAGDMIYGLKAGLDGGDYTIVVKKTSPNKLTDSLADSTGQDWGLKMYTPTNFDDGNAKEGTVTLTATCV